MRLVLLNLIFTCLLVTMQAQSTAYVLQGGLTMATQRWDNNFDREPMFSPHMALAIESVNNDNDASSFFAQLGYHVKGSAQRFQFINLNNNLPFPGVVTQRFEFNNVSLILGAKQKKPLREKSKFYYFGGLRGDYTVDTNIDRLTDGNPFLTPFYPFVAYMNRWMFGLSLGGGLEFKFSELIGGEIKLSVNPDLTLQYNQPPILNVQDPFNPGQNRTIEARRIRNLTIELSAGIRLLRKVEYIDE